MTDSTTSSTKKMVFSFVKMLFSLQFRFTNFKFVEKGVGYRI